MSEKVIVALDAMGGDNAPVEIVKGAVEAVKEEAGLLVKLVGREEQVRAELAKYTYPQGQIEVVDAPDVIETGEQPVMAIRRKKDSSMVRALTMVKEKKADAFVSAGSSGAILVGGQVIVGRIRGVERPPMAPLIPTAICNTFIFVSFLFCLMQFFQYPLYAERYHFFDFGFRVYLERKFCFDIAVKI